jgi:hypothetical protein
VNGSAASSSAAAMSAPVANTGRGVAPASFGGAACVPEERAGGGAALSCDASPAGSLFWLALARAWPARLAGAGRACGTAAGAGLEARGAGAADFGAGAGAGAAGGSTRFGSSTAWDTASPTVRCNSAGP